MVQDAIRFIKFRDLNIRDPFFSSLVIDYPGFLKWFEKKQINDESAYVLFNTSGIEGMLYLKDETEANKDINPVFPKKRRLKIGTFKIDAHGTVLGQRFISIIVQKMINESFTEVYVTLFGKQKPLIRLFEKFGFVYWGKKINGELVYVKNLVFQDDMYKDFPKINRQANKFLLSIFPQFHTQMFPDSKLCTERQHVIEDLAYTNTIEKVYVSKILKCDTMKVGDLVVIYRTKEQNIPAKYSSVVTSVCTVADIAHISQFSGVDSFLDYCGKGSIFSDAELVDFYDKHQYPYIIKMLYNFPLKKRIIRRDLIELVGLSSKDYWGCMQLSDAQFDKILEMSDTNESFIIN